MAVITEKQLKLNHYEIEIMVKLLENKIRAWDWAIDNKKGTLDDQDGFKKKIEISNNILKKLGHR